MASLSRRSQHSSNTWPGFVDALATLLMVIIFVLLVFVLAQFYLSEALTGRDEALHRLQDQVSELADLLSLERQSNTELRLNVAQLSEELQASVARGDDLGAALQALTLRAETAEERARDVEKSLAEAFETITADKETIEAKVKELAALTQDVAALRALREELEKEITDLAARTQTAEGKLAETEEERLRAATALLDEKKLSETARAQVALLNQQMAALREQLANLVAALDLAEAKAKDQEVQIASLGKKLNAALASKVQELTKYRSEFFGRLREVLGDQRGVRIVGDRFVFQSEVLFASGSADLEKAGQAQMAQLATTLREVSKRIPEDVNWILRVDGHTDTVPIRNERFPSNWELSSARAISVVKFLMSRGISADRLVAAGFGKFQPLDDRDDEIARRRNRRIELKLTQR